MPTDTSPGSGALPARVHLAPVPGEPVLDVVIPVFNEEKDLGPCVHRLHDHLTKTFPYPFRITIADNASTDGTPDVAAALAAAVEDVHSTRLEEKGRGRALRTVWSRSQAPVLAYMDVDLSTDLNALLPLVAPLISGHSDLAIGTRLARSSRVVRGAKREFVSRAYNLLLRSSLAARFTDAQCGFKAIRRDVAQRLLPLVEDSGWFFDTELLVLAERAGLRIHEVPVDWVDDPDSTVHIVRTAAEDLKGVWRVGRALAVGALPLDRLARPFGDDPRDRTALPGVPCGLTRQLLGFCAVGLFSTLLYLALYAAFRTAAGPQIANAAALLLSAVANTAANHAAHLRGARPHPSRAPPGTGAGGLRHRPRPDQRLTRRAGGGGRRTRPQHRTRRTDHRQPRRHRAALPPVPRLGLSRAARQSHEGRHPMTTAAVPLFPPAPPTATTTAVTGKPRWERPSYTALLLLTAVLLLWNLGASGYANSFYSAAVQAGSESWKAFFFGSSDAGNSITVDKPPAALWPMALSVRLFGLGGWQILVPQALMGVGTTAVLYGAVRRQFGPVAALLSGVAFALTPVAALMFRFNNPDALLALLMTVTVSCVLRALDGARTGWLVGAGAAVGLAFLTKTLQAFVILPPLAVLYAVCAPTRLRRRLGQLLLAGVAMVVAGGWWVAVVELWPAGSRPYIGGSQNNSFLELTLGYNGLGRINGNETGSVGGGGRPGGGGGGGWGETGIDRLFTGTIGGQISWLLPAALIMLVAGLVITWKARRATDSLESMARASFLAWGGSLLITGLVFSYMQGIFHEYYTVALAPFLAALVGMGVVVLWEERGSRAASLTLAGSLALTAYWAFVLLGRAPGYLPWLRWTVLAAGIGAAVALPFAARLGRRALRQWRASLWAQRWRAPSRTA